MRERLISPGPQPRGDGRAPKVQSAHSARCTTMPAGERPPLTLELLGLSPSTWLGLGSSKGQVASGASACVVGSLVLTEVERAGGFGEEKQQWAVGNVLLLAPPWSDLVGSPLWIAFSSFVKWAVQLDK